MPKQNLVYFGTPEVAVEPLVELFEAGHEIHCVVTGIDKPRGRGQKITPTPVKAAAQELGLKVCHNPQDALEFSQVQNLLGIVVAYGQILKPPVLGAFPLINMHFSLLPRWRGAAPVERAILAGDKETGVCLMELEESLDTGPVYLRSKVTITSAHNTKSLKDDLQKEGIELFHQLLENELPTPRPQSGTPTWAEKINSTDLELDLNQSAKELMQKIRVGGAWIRMEQLQDTQIGSNQFESDKKLKVHDARLMDGLSRNKSDFYVKTKNNETIEFKTVQPEGKARMSGSAWCHGIKNK